MARGKAPIADATTLQMALVGYQVERQKIDDKIREIEALLGGRRGPAPAAKAAVAGVAAAPRKRNLSAAARRRIAMAQKRRWAEHRRKAALAAKAAKSAAKAEE